MPPEPLPWDRKDFFKEKKHERSESLGSLGGGRWRDSSSHHGYRESNRWGSTDYRRPPGHGKQGGSRMFPEESSHGFSISRSGDKMLEDENCRLSISRGEGKYGRSSRDSRGYFSQRDYRGCTWESSNVSPNVSGRSSDANNDPRSLDDYPPNSLPYFVHTWDQGHKVGGVKGLGEGERYDTEDALGSVDWEPCKWTRSGSRGFSGGSRSNGGADSGEGKADLRLKSGTPVDSSSGAVAACVRSAASCEETTSRKKPRLGWGDGLAKFEKKNVEGPDVSTSKDVAVFRDCASEPSPCVGATLVDKSPKMTGFSDCGSPATPSSVACSSSPGLEDKPLEKVPNVELDVSNLSGLPVHEPQHHLEGSSFYLEDVGTDSLATLGSSITELLQEDPASVDSIPLRSSAIEKLLIWKVDLSKVLESTESEIDLLETELNSLRSELRDSRLHPPVSSSMINGFNARSCDRFAGDSDMASQLKCLQIAPTADANMENPPVVHVNVQSSNINSKDDDIDSPGTATSKFVEPTPLVQVVKDGVFSSDMDFNQSTSSKVNCLVACSKRREANMFASGDNGMFGLKGRVEISAGHDPCDNLNDTGNIIISANQKLAESASEIFDMLMPIDCCKMDKVGPTSDVCHQNNPLMEAKFASSKRLLRFKEKVIAIKFKALRHLWREDMRSLSIKKSCLKSRRKLEVSLRKVGCGYQKLRSSIRSRFSDPTGNLSLVPTSEMIAYTKKLLSTSQHAPVGNSLKMPVMILDDKEKVSRFISSNGLVEDPLAYEKERAMINPWMSDEKEIFLDKLVIYGKDFCKIASFLDHKTTADCVEFYYKNHKSESFSRIMKQEGKPLSLTTKLVRSGSKWNREINAASLDILSAASVMAGQVNGIRVHRQKHSGRSLLGGYGSGKTSIYGNGVLKGSNSLYVVDDERETVAAGVLAGICDSFPPEVINSGVRKSVDPTEEHGQWKCLKVCPNQCALNLDVVQSMDDETCSDESSGDMDPSDWMDEEKTTFVRALSSYGKDFSMISRCLRTRSRDECKVFFSKARKCLGLDAICSRPEKEGSPMNDDANGGDTDAEAACAVEIGSVADTKKLGNKIEDIPSPTMILCNDESYAIDGSNLSVEGLNKFDVEQRNHEDADSLLFDLSRMSDGNITGGSHKQPSVAHADKNKTAAANSEACGVPANELGSTCAKSISAEDATKGDQGDTEDSGICKLKCPDQDPCAVQNGFNPVGEISCSVSNFGPRDQLEVPCEKPEVMSSPRGSCRSGMNSVLRDSASIKFEKMDCQDQLSSKVDLRGSKVMDSRKPAERRNGLRGFPLQVTVNEEVNDNVSCASSTTELSFLCRKGELGGQPNSHSRSSSDLEKSGRNDNVKLFDKILANSSIQKPILTDKNESESISHNKNIGSKTSTVSHKNLDGSCAGSKFDRGDLQVENIPVKSKGLWEGNRKPSWISPLPDPSALLPKCPADFVVCPTAHPRPEQHACQTVGNGNGRSLNGVSALGNREKNQSNVVVDCRSPDGKKMLPPLKADLKQRRDI